MRKFRYCIIDAGLWAESHHLWLLARLLTRLHKALFRASEGKADLENLEL